MACSIWTQPMHRLDSRPGGNQLCMLSSRQNYGYRNYRQNLPQPPVLCAASPSGEEFIIPKLLPRRQRADWSCGPSFELTWEEALDMQLQALKDNNAPTPDTGIEVLYRFADIDPWTRSKYFGRSLDLGQFERFRRVFHTRQYSLLLSHTLHEKRSQLQLGEDKVVQRVMVTGYRNGEQASFDFTMVRRVGGRYDGFWFTQSLICDATDETGLVV